MDENDSQVDQHDLDWAAAWAEVLDEANRDADDHLSPAERALVLSAQEGLVRQHDLAVALGVTDKRVATWRTRRAANGFPEPVACHFGPSDRGGKRRHMLWDLRECVAWFSRYDVKAQRARGGIAQRGRTYPKRSKA